ASHLSDAAWPATKDDLIDYSIRPGAPLEVVENLQSMEEDGGEFYESIVVIWPDYPTEDDYLWNEDEYYNINGIRNHKSHMRLFFYLILGLEIRYPKDGMAPAYYFFVYIHKKRLLPSLSLII